MAMFTKNKEKNDEAEDAIAVADVDAAADETEEAPASEAPADDAAVSDEAEAEVGEEGAPAEEAEANADEAANDDDDEDEDDEDDESGGDDLDLDLMDIFEAEQNETTSTASIYSEFLEDLTMEEVLDQAHMLLDEIRAKLGR